MVPVNLIGDFGSNYARGVVNSLMVGAEVHALEYDLAEQIPVRAGVGAVEDVDDIVRLLHQFLGLGVHHGLGGISNTDPILVDLRQQQCVVDDLGPQVLQRVGRRVSDFGKEISLCPCTGSITYFAEVTNPAANPLENLRPQVIYNALLLPEIDKDEIAVLENDTEAVVDAKTKKLVQQPDYVIDIIHRSDSGSAGICSARSYSSA